MGFIMAGESVALTLARFESLNSTVPTEVMAELATIEEEVALIKDEPTGGRLIPSALREDFTDDFLGWVLELVAIISVRFASISAILPLFPLILILAKALEERSHLLLPSPPRLLDFLLHCYSEAEVLLPP